MQPRRRSRATFFVGSLPGTINEDTLWSYFTRFGTPISLDIIRKRDTKICRGYGFLVIELGVTDGYFLAFEHFFQDRRLTIEPFIAGERLIKKKMDFDNRRLFVKNLSPSINQNDLISYFSNFGIVDNAYTAPNFEVGTNSLIGCVHFAQAESIKTVLKQKHHYIKGYHVKCERFEKKGNEVLQHQHRMPKHKELQANPNHPIEKHNFSTYDLSYHDLSNSQLHFKSHQTKHGGIPLSMNSLDDFGPTLVDHQTFSKICKAKPEPRQDQQEFIRTAFKSFYQGVDQVIEFRHQENRENLRFNLFKPSQ